MHPSANGVNTVDDVISHEVTIHVGDCSTMDAFTVRPNDDASHPGLIVLQEAFGVNSHIRNVAQRLAREGYVAVAPELYHRTAPGLQAAYSDFNSVMPHMRAMSEDGLTADLRASLGWLVSNDFVQRDSIGSIGFCMGGRVSFLADAVLPVKAAVSFYGGGIAPNQMSPGLLNRAGELHAPILLFWGGKDQHIPPEQRRAVADALLAAGKRFVHVGFSDADHGFFCDERPSYNPQAAKQAWALMMEFLGENLAPGASPR
jgi:carboxymethylenebutenolidase